MAIAPDYWPQAREGAPIHVQIRIKKRPHLKAGGSILAGPVVRIFRDGRGRMKLGESKRSTWFWRW